MVNKNHGASRKHKQAKWETRPKKNAAVDGRKKRNPYRKVNHAPFNDAKNLCGKGSYDKWKTPTRRDKMLKRTDETGIKNATHGRQNKLKENVTQIVERVIRHSKRSCVYTHLQSLNGGLPALRYELRFFIPSTASSAH